MTRSVAIVDGNAFEWLVVVVVGVGSIHGIWIIVVVGCAVCGHGVMNGCLCLVDEMILCGLLFSFSRISFLESFFRCCRRNEFVVGVSLLFLIVAWMSLWKSFTKKFCMLYVDTTMMDGI